MIERNCAQAQRMAKRLVAIPGAEVLNEVVLNQVLVRLPGGDDANRAAVSWATTDKDIDRSAAAIAAAVNA
jgi:threonine aldolase